MTAIAELTADALAVTVARDMLRDALAAVGPVIKSNPSLPVLEMVRLATRDQRLSITATDLETWVTRTAPAETGLEAGEALVPYAAFAQLVKDLPPESVKLASDGAVKVRLKCGKVRGTLLGYPAGEYPMVPGDLSDGFATGARLTVGQLAVLTTRAAYAVAGPEHGGREYLRGVLCELRGDRLRFVATDGHRMAVADLPLEGGSDIGDVIVPPDVLAHVQRCFSEDEELEVSRSAVGLAFRGESGAVVARVIEGRYPQYEQLFPKEHKCTAIVNRAAFQGAVRRALAVAAGEYRRTALSFAPGKLSLQTQGQDIGAVEDEVPCDFTGEPTRLGANGSYLAEILQHLPGDDVRVEMGGPERAVAMRPDSDHAPGECRVLFMPLRLLD